MWAEHPEIARRWSEKYKNKKNLPMYVNPEKNDKNGSKKEAQLETKPHKLKSAKKPHNILPFFVTSEKNATVFPLNSVKSNTLFTPADTFSGKWKRKDIEASMSDCDEKIAVNALLNKIAAVINPNLLRALEERKALAEARKARYIPNNVNLKQYPAAMQGPAIPPPMGMSAPPPQPPQQQSPTPPQNAVGGGNHPSANPINTFGGLSMSGDLNGNAAFGAKNSPDSSKIAAAITKWAAADTPCSCGCGDTVATCKCGKDCKCRKPGGSCYKAEGEKESAAQTFGRALAIKFAAKSPAWQREAGKNEEGGLNAKGRASYNKATGGNLKAPVTQKNPKGKAKSRRASFCARMGGMKKKLTGEKTKNDPDSRINKALRKWNC